MISLVAVLLLWDLRRKRDAGLAEALPVIPTPRDRPTDRLPLSRSNAIARSDRSQLP